MLVVTSSVRMLNRIHSHTTHLRPAVPLHSEFVVCVTSLEKWLLSPTSTGTLPNHSSATTWNNLLCTRWKLDSGGVVIGVVTDDDSVVTGSSGEDTAISDVVLDVADDGSFRDGSDREDVADHECSFLTAVDELASVHALGGNEELLLLHVAERVAESDAG